MAGRSDSPHARGAAWRWLAALVVLAACARAETPRITPTPFRLRFIVDTSLSPLTRALADAYAVYRPNAGIAIEYANGTAALQAVANGRADLAIAGLDAVEGSGLPALWSRDLAYEGIAIIVNPRNPLSGLSLPLARDVFSGARSQWSDLGVASLGDITLAVRDEGDSSRQAFDRQVMGPVRLSSNALVLSSLDVAVNLVAAEPTSIAYAPSSWLTGSRASRVKVLPLDGVPPSSEAIATGAYPVPRPVNLIAPAEPSGELRQFVAWALSAEGQRVAAAQGFVPAGQMQR